MSINPLDYVLTRMQEIKPRFEELSTKDALEAEERSEYDRTKTEWDALDERRIDLEERQSRAVAAKGVNFNRTTATRPFEADLRTTDQNQVLGMGRAAIDEMEARFANRDEAEQMTRLVERGGSIGEIAARLAVTTGSPEYRQAFLARIVDVGAELFAMAAVCSRADALSRAEDPRGDSAVTMADVFCQQSRLRVEALFEALWSNSDSSDKNLAAAVLAGDMTWLEAGVIDGSEGTGPWIATWEPGPSAHENVRRRYR